MIDAFKMFKALFELLTVAFKGGFTVVSNKIHFIYNRLAETVDTDALGIQRALVLRVHNGGGNLSSSRPTYVSVTYEESRKPLKQISRNYQNILADKHMMRILQDVKLNGEVILNVEDIPDDAYLKDFYTTQGVLHVRIFFIKETKGGFLWRETKELHLLSVSTTETNVNLKSHAANEACLRLRTDIKRNLK